MLNITKKEIDNKIENVFSIYDDTIKYFSNNDLEKAFVNLNNLRMANSEIYNFIYNYSGRDTKSEFSKNYFNFGEEYLLDKNKKNKINNYQKEIYEKIRLNQQGCIKNNSEKYFIRLYIERHLPLIWNKNSDLLFIANNTDLNLIQELININQKNIFVINQNIKIINDYIKKNNINYKGLKLVNSLKDKGLNSFFLNPTNNRINYQIWADFPNTLKNKFNNKDITNLKKQIDIILKKNSGGSASTFRTLWIKNGISNLKTIFKLPNINKFKKKFTNQSAIIVCPGPSLKNNLDDLQKLKDKYFICSLGHSLMALDEKKITPDMLIHVDPASSEWYRKTLKNYNFSKIKLLILAATCEKQLFKKKAKNIAWVSTNNSYDDWICDLIGDKNSLLNVVNVSHVALTILTNLGFKNIAFIGLDHSITENKFYINSKASTSEDLKIWGMSKLRTWPAINGGIVKSNYKFINSIMVFERLIKRIKSENNNVNLYNCTYQGALIKGFNNITLKDYYKKTYSEQSKKNNLILEVVNKIDKFLELECNKKKMLDSFFYKLKDDIDNLLLLLNEALKLLALEILNNENLIELQSLSDKVTKIINNSKILALGTEKYFIDYIQRKEFIVNYKEEILLYRNLFENLYNFFIEFQIFIKKNNS